MKVFKYYLPLFGVDEVNMPEGAKVISVGLQEDFDESGEDVVLWAIVEPEPNRNKLVPRQFLTVYTGEDFDPKGKVFIGTVQRKDGIVLHIFEVDA